MPGTPIREAEKGFVRDFRITGEILEKSATRRAAQDVKLDA